MPGKNGTATLVITNTGNVTASGTLDLNLVASTDGLVDATDIALAPIPSRKIKIGARKSISIKVKFTAPNDLIAGSYDLIASMTSSTSPADTDSANDTATVGNDVSSLAMKIAWTSRRNSEAYVLANLSHGRLARGFKVFNGHGRDAHGTFF